MKFTAASRLDDPRIVRYSHGLKHLHPVLSADPVHEKEEHD
jgi:hypothetical protein